MSIEFISHKLFGDIKIESKGTSPGSILPTGPTEFNMENSLYLKNLMQYWNYPYASKKNINELIPKFQYNALSFCLALDAYQESKTFLIEPKTILMKSICEGPSFSSELKKIRFYSFVEKTIQGVCEEPRSAQLGKTYMIHGDIGRIFNYRYLFNWVEETNDFLEYAFIPVVERNLDFLKESFLFTLPDEVPIYPKEEVLFSKSSSKTLYNGVSQFNYELTPFQKLNSFNNHIGRTKLCKIQKTAGDPREIVIMELYSLNTVKWIDNQVKLILAQLEENMMIPNIDAAISKLESVAKLHYKRIFYSRDLKKEGWTKPRYLLRFVLEVLNEKYDWNLPSQFYDFFEVQYEDHIYTPIRGHGLGTANSLTTLLYILLHRYICGDCKFTDTECDLDIQALVLNDDFLAYGKEVDLEEYKGRESELFSYLGLITNNEKSYTSNIGFSFAENYFEEGLLLTKESYLKFWSYIPLLAINIRHAKVLAQAMDPSLHNIKTYTDWFGYEFFPEEYLYPASLGGWVSPKLNGADISLMTITEYFPIISKACVALDSYVPMPNLKRNSRPKVEKLIYPSFLRGFEEDILEDLGFSTNVEFWKKSFLTAKYSEVYWRRTYSAVQKVFKSTNSMLHCEFVEYFLQNHENSLPPSCYPVEQRSPGLSFRRPVFEGPAPHLSYCAYKNKAIVSEVIPSPFGLSDKPDSKSRILSAAFRTRIRYYEEILGEVSVNSNLPDWWLTSYRDPISVASVLNAYTLELPKVASLINKFPENVRIQEILQNYPLSRDCFPLFNAIYIKDFKVDNIYLEDALDKIFGYESEEVEVIEAKEHSDGSEIDFADLFFKRVISTPKEIDSDPLEKFQKEDIMVVSENEKSDTINSDYLESKEDFRQSISKEPVDDTESSCSTSESEEDSDDEDEDSERKSSESSENTESEPKDDEDSDEYTNESDESDVPTDYTDSEDSNKEKKCLDLEEFFKRTDSDVERKEREKEEYIPPPSPKKERDPLEGLIPGSTLYVLACLTPEEKKAMENSNKLMGYRDPSSFTYQTIGFAEPELRAIWYRNVHSMHNFLLDLGYPKPYVNLFPDNDMCPSGQDNLCEEDFNENGSEYNIWSCFDKKG